MIKKNVQIALSLIAAGLCHGAEVPDMLVSGYGSGATLVRSGQPAWNYGNGNGPCQDAWQLADGNYLIPTSDTVQMVTPGKQTLWKYQGKTPAGLTTPPKNPAKLKRWKPGKLEIHSCQPLPNGNVLIAEGSYARLIEVDQSGAVVKTIEIKDAKPNNHLFNRMVRKTKQGTYVVVLSASDRVSEYDGTGALLRSVTPETTASEGIKWGHVHGLAVLENGNWLIGTGRGATFFEIDKNDKVVWKLTPADVPEIKLSYAAGLQRLDDGTTVLAAFRSGCQVFAVDKENNVLWKWKSAEARDITHVQVLTAP